MVRESTLVNNVIDMIKLKYGGYAIKVHGTGMSSKGEPDIIGTVKGITLAIECKVGNNKPSRIQRHRMMKWHNSGASVAVIRSTEEFSEFMEYVQDRDPSADTVDAVLEIIGD